MCSVVFKRITQADVPEKWKQAAARAPPKEVNRDLGLAADVKVDVHVILELPDYPIARAWMKWYEALESEDAVSVMLSSQHAWETRKQELKESLQMLLAEGRPKMIWGLAYVPARSKAGMNPMRPEVKADKVSTHASPEG